MSGSVNKRATLPGAAELFGGGKAAQSKPETKKGSSGKSDAASPAPSGRVKHEQKITVYFSNDEFFALEDATLEVRRRMGRPVDRGRIVRAAVALVLADLAAEGDDAAVIKALDEG